MARYDFANEGTCSESVSFSLDGGRLASVRFSGGCPGNLAGIARLVEGLEAEEAARRLEGIRCGSKSTSCPDQLAKAIRRALGAATTQGSAP
ncbi:MAG TPA: TIGR03905 family TSCPD domain-containing protein [Spirochaetia bacterium]|nr:TIGR03905 family TSCPD domain-containing protein [Spirochaetales bacterium]HRY71879.1 TIGR03905 family TSCPD domain-containing protein [Spirochaetia bacterium]